MKIISRDIVNLLAKKHSEDVFVKECKDGPTHRGSHSRLDGWAMKRSWSKPLVVGYEIKVSRGDFLQDDKWPNYLGMCNQLYFVCPTGVIDPSEIPEGVGLMWASKNCARLYTKRKAPHRDVEIPESVWRYVLMCRAVITRENQTGSEKQFWENWLKQKKIDQHFGWQVSSTLSRRIKEEVFNAQEKNKQLESRLSKYDELIKFLKSIDIDPTNNYGLSTWDIERKINKAREVLPSGLIDDLRKVSQRAENTAIKLEMLNNET